MSGGMTIVAMPLPVVPMPKASPRRAWNQRPMSSEMGTVPAQE